MYSNRKREYLIPYQRLLAVYPRHRRNNLRISDFDFDYKTPYADQHWVHAGRFNSSRHL
jgi:hypothetical protein